MAIAKEKIGKKNGEQFDCNKSEAMRYVFRTAKQSKDRKDVAEMPCIQRRDGMLIIKTEEKIKAGRSIKRR